MNMVRFPENACKPNPCSNGGKCSADKFGDYSCECQKGYYGPECESKFRSFKEVISHTNGH